MGLWAEINGRVITIYEVYKNDFIVRAKSVEGKVKCSIKFDGEYHGIRTCVPETDRAMITVVVYNGYEYRFEVYSFDGEKWVEVDP